MEEWKLKKLLALDKSQEINKEALNEKMRKKLGQLTKEKGNINSNKRYASVEPMRMSIDLNKLNVQSTYGKPVVNQNR